MMIFWCFSVKFIIHFYCIDKSSMNIQDEGVNDDRLIINNRNMRNQTAHLQGLVSFVSGRHATRNRCQATQIYKTNMYKNWESI